MSATRYAKVTLGFGALLFIFAVLFESIDTAHAGSYTVCQDGCAYTSVQVAVDAAATGATITVAPGTYDEAVIVSKPVTIRGSGIDSIVTGKRNSGSTHYPAFTATASGVTLDGFRVGSLSRTDRFYAGVDTGDVSNVTLENISYHNVSIGVYARGTRSLRIDGNTFFHVYTGIILQQTTDARLGLALPLSFSDVDYAAFEIHDARDTDIRNATVTDIPRIASSVNAANAQFSGIKGSVSVSAFELTGVSDWTLSDSSLSGAGNNAALKVIASPILSSGVSVLRTSLINFTEDVESPDGSLAQPVTLRGVTNAVQEASVTAAASGPVSTVAPVVASGPVSEVTISQSVPPILPATGAPKSPLPTIALLGGALGSGIIGTRRLTSNTIDY